MRERIGGAGSRLQRYSGRFSCVEINSTFYRPHRPATYARWAAEVPPDFRFALKIPKEITHRRRLIEADEPLERFLAESAALGEKRAVLLVQLPPSLAYDAAAAQGFFGALRARFDGLVVCEPRHPSWFAGEADAALARMLVARVGADPPVVPAAAEAGGWDGFAYYRLHGSPRMYYSAYGPSALQSVARRLRAARGPAWCIFDNTAMGAGAGDALALTELLESGRVGAVPVPNDPSA